MKNSPLTIILIIAVVLIWAWIMYSVFDYMESPEVRTANTKAFVSVISTDTITNDYVLALNYKDPFLKKEYYAYKGINKITNNNTVSRSANNTSAQKNKNKKVIEEEVPIPVVQYVGRIHNSKLKKPIAILVIDNKEYMMQEGQTNDGIILKQIANDSATIMFSKKIFYVKKQ